MVSNLLRQKVKADNLKPRFKWRSKERLKQPSQSLRRCHHLMITYLALNAISHLQARLAWGHTCSTTQETIALHVTPVRKVLLKGSRTKITSGNMKVTYTSVNFVIDHLLHIEGLKCTRGFIHKTTHFTVELVRQDSATDQSLRFTRTCILDEELLVWDVAKHFIVRRTSRNTNRNVLLKLWQTTSSFIYI